MANLWLRLWHDMPNDPKWRTIARASKQSIPSVIAVYVHLLVNASNATERGRTQNVCNEDIASALDLECEQIDAIISAMQGRVLEGDYLSGWSKRQVEREDGSAERSKRWREAQKEAKQTQPNAGERKRTPDTDKDTDKDTELKKPTAEYSAEFELAWAAYPKREGASKKDSFKAWSARIKGGVLPSVMIAGAERYAAYCKAQGTEQQYIKQPATFFGVGEHYLADWKPIQVPRRGTPPPENFAQRDYGTGVQDL